MVLTILVTSKRVRVMLTLSNSFSRKPNNRSTKVNKTMVGTLRWNTVITQPLLRDSGREALHHPRIINPSQLPAKVTRHVCSSPCNWMWNSATIRTTRLDQLPQRLPKPQPRMLRWMLNLIYLKWMQESTITIILSNKTSIMTKKYPKCRLTYTKSSSSIIIQCHAIKHQYSVCTYTLRS